jgi:dTDP-4-amino-4,6-dideoxygalactose transaminase
VDIDRFHKLAKKHDLAIIEDAACAIGSRYKGRPIGGDGTIACFSFHPRKVITTGEGGAITTNDAELAARLRLLRQHGMSVPDTVRHAARQVIVEEYVCTGYNYRMTDVQAAIGIEQLRKLDWIISSRRSLAARYTAALAEHPWLRPPFVPDYAEPTFQSYAASLTREAPVSRNAVMQSLLDQGISTRRGIMLAHREPAYAGHEHTDLHRSEEASDQSILLPLYPQLTHADQDRVIDALFQLAVHPTTTCAGA